MEWAVRFHFDNQNADALRVMMQRFSPQWFSLNREPDAEWPYRVTARSATQAKYRIHSLIKRTQDSVGLMNGVGMKDAKIRYETEPKLPPELGTPHLGKFARIAIINPADRHAVFLQLQEMGYEPVEFADDGDNVGGVGFDNYHPDVPWYDWANILAAAYERAGVDRRGENFTHRLQFD